MGKVGGMVEVVRMGGLVVTRQVGGVVDSGETSESVGLGWLVGADGKVVVGEEEDDFGR